MWDERFEEFLRRHLPFLPADAVLDEDLSLGDFGLDSMGLVGLLADLEKGYDVRFVDDSLNMENFSTPGRLWLILSALEDGLGSRSSESFS
jgi:acyl carrier protein